jgi:hypothetical protein
LEAGKNEEQGSEIFGLGRTQPENETAIYFAAAGAAVSGAAAGAAASGAAAGAATGAAGSATGAATGAAGAACSTGGATTASSAFLQAIMPVESSSIKAKATVVLIDFMVLFLSLCFNNCDNAHYAW